MEENLCFRNHLLEIEPELISMVEGMHKRSMADQMEDGVDQILVATRTRLNGLIGYSTSILIVEKELKEIRSLIEESFHQSRSLMPNFDLPELIEKGLMLAIRWLAGRMWDIWIIPPMKAASNPRGGTPRDTSQRSGS